MDGSRSDDLPAHRRENRERLATIVQDPDADLAEVAAIIATESHPLGADLVAPTMLRLDALADRLRTSGVQATGDAAADATTLAERMGEGWGIRGHGEGERVPADSLMDQVLERRRGLPITLSIFYVALGQRRGMRLFPVALPGHVVTAVLGAPDDDQPPVIIDPFQGGVRLDDDDLRELVRRATDGQLEFTPEMVRPATPLEIARRLLNNLTHDYSAQGDLEQALWTVECKLVLPDEVHSDHRDLGRVLEQLGRFDDAAAAYERYAEVAPDEPDAEEVRRDALRARARTN